MEVMNFKIFEVVSLKLILTILMISVIGCSDDDNETMEEEPVDLQVVSGGYLGTSGGNFGAGSISMELTDTGNNIYAVDFYWTGTFRSGFNRDSSPDAIGTIELDGEKADIELRLETTDPPCKGNYVGTGTRSAEGVFTLEMDLKQDCGTNGLSTFILTKIKN